MRRRLVLWLAMIVGLASPAGAGAPIAVCATTSDLGALVREIGGADVALVTFARGTEDPHFVETRPSFLRALADAELLVLNGLDLEVGWLPNLIQSARNALVRPGAAGYLDASIAITPLDVPSGTIDRSMGDVHSRGNPHYLLDPVNGVAVAALVRDALVRLRPSAADGFRGRWKALRDRVEIGLVGTTLADRYDGLKLAELAALGGLARFLDERGETDALSGWLGALARHRGAKIVVDHRVWTYFAHRFGLEIAETLEAVPGYPPTTRHLASVVESMKRDHIGVVLTSAYFDPRHAELIARATGARVLAMANQVGARPAATDYVSTIDSNVRTLAAGLGEGR